MNIRLICDTSCTVSEHYRQSLNIPQVPAWINFFDGTSLRNGVDISDEAFYQRLETEKHLPTTSQPTPQDFAEAIEQINADEIIVAAVSSKLSGTYSSAVQAVDLLPDRTIHVYDTLSASVGSAWQIIAGAELAAQGADADAILAEMHRVRQESVVLFVIDTLKYLAASGRAPALQAIVGNILHIKPMLHIEDGRIELSGRVRGRKHSKRELINQIAEWAGGRPLRLALANANVPDEAEAFAQDVREQINVKELEIIELGPVLGALVGPGTLALGGYPLN